MGQVRLAEGGVDGTQQVDDCFRATCLYNGQVSVEFLISFTKSSLITPVWEGAHRVINLRANGERCDVHTLERWRRFSDNDSLSVHS